MLFCKDRRVIDHLINAICCLGTQYEEICFDNVVYLTHFTQWLEIICQFSLRMLWMHFLLCVIYQWWIMKLPPAILMVDLLKNLMIIGTWCVCVHAYVTICVCVCVFEYVLLEMNFDSFRNWQLVMCVLCMYVCMCVIFVYVYMYMYVSYLSMYIVWDLPQAFLKLPYNNSISQTTQYQVW